MRWYPTALMLLLAVPPPSVTALQASSKAEAYERCMSTHFLLPGVTSNDERRFASMVTVRAMRSECGGEVQATLAKQYEPGSDIVVTVIKATGKSVYEQLEVLQSKHPDHSYDHLCGDVDVERESLRFGEAHAVAALLGELSNLEISPMPPEDLVLDGSRYLIQVWSGFGRSDFMFDGTGTVENSPTISPLEAWLLRVFTDLGLSCVPSKPPGPATGDDATGPQPERP